MFAALSVYVRLSSTSSRIIHFLSTGMIWVYTCIFCCFHEFLCCGVRWEIGNFPVINERFCTQICTNFYAPAFRRWRHYVFELSFNPSARSPKYPLFTCRWVRWSVRPTVTVLWHVCPSVRPSARKDFCAFAGKRLEGMAWYFAERIRLRSWSVDFFWFWLYF